jgi:glycosyltransferase involved in cell wall biosynthesis
MALGRPVVSTPLGCEGLDVQDGKHVLIADGPQDFARRLDGLLADAERRRRIAVEARALVERLYSWDRLAKLLLDEYELLGGPGNAGAG